MPPLRVILYERGHHKNLESIPRMCAAVGATFEYTTDIDRLRRDDYDFLISFSFCIDPSIPPPHVKVLLGPGLTPWPEGKMLGEYEVQQKKRYAINGLADWVIKSHLTEHPHIYFLPIPLPLGINTEMFSPSGEERIQVLLYIKHRHTKDILFIQRALQIKNINPIIFNYDVKYAESDYLGALRQAKYMVVVGSTESQGYALQEAMSAGVPLLVWDADSLYDEHYGTLQNYKFDDNPRKGTTIPYWSDECGIRVAKHDVRLLGKALEQMESSWRSFRPRDYILRTLSDKVCMERILNYFGFPVEPTV